jgi:hypothetical protein
LKKENKSVKGCFLCRYYSYGRQEHPLFALCKKSGYQIIFNFFNALQHNLTRLMRVIGRILENFRGFLKNKLIFFVDQIVTFLPQRSLVGAEQR